MWLAPEQFFIDRHVPGDHARDVVLLAGSLLGPRAEFASTRRSIEQLVDRGCECARVPGGDEGAGTTVVQRRTDIDRKSTRLNSSHVAISYAVFCLKKKK